MVEFLSGGDLNKVRTIKGVFGFHHFKPSFNGFLYICKGFFAGVPLRKTAQKCRNLCNVIAGLILFDNYVSYLSVNLNV